MVTEQARSETADHPPPATTSTMDDLPNTTADPRGNDQHDDDDLVQVQGARPSEPLLVRRGWLRDHLPKSSTSSSLGANSPSRRSCRATR